MDFSVGSYSCRGFIFLTMLLVGCETPVGQLESITTAEFALFVEATNYVTDAEKYGWSIVQETIEKFEVVENATWRLPDGEQSAFDAEPVTQVSYNDAIAYCKWSNTSLPTYKEYWTLIDTDKRKIVTNGSGSITDTEKANILGNVWEITSTTIGDSIRIAGGSIFCSKETCHGTSINRELYVDKETGNIHIGFAVLVKSG